MIWQILILTQPSRAAMLEQLIDEFRRQYHGDDVGIVEQKWDNSLDLGQNRNALKARATADYVSYFDDDDWPAPNFIPRILDELQHKPDYVGFQVQTYCAHLNYQPYGMTYHSLEYTGWTRKGMLFYRDISHVNPLRRELAMLADFDGGFGEDGRWAAKIRATGKVKTQRYIPEVMYHYIWRAVKSNDAEDATDPRRLQIIEQARASNKVEQHCIQCDNMMERGQVWM